MSGILGSCRETESDQGGGADWSSHAPRAPEATAYVHLARRSPQTHAGELTRPTFYTVEPLC